MNQNRKVMAYTKLIVEKQDNICTVKINNPEALNALNSTILKELDAAFTAIGEDDSVDVVILKKYAHATAQQLARVLDRVERVSGEAGDFFGDNQIELTFSSVLDHAVKVLTLLRRDTGQALVNVHRHECPREIPSDQILIVGNLIAQ